MRVLIAADFFPPTIGGLEKHAERLASALVTQGHIVQVVTLATKRTPETTVQNGIVIHRVNGWSHRVPGVHADPDRPFPLPTLDPGLAGAVRQVIDDFDPDVVHVHGWMAASVASAARRHRSKVVVTLHDSGLACPKRTLYQHDLAPCTGPSLLKCLSCTKPHYGAAKGTAITAMLKTAPLWLRHVDRFLPVAGVVGDVTKSLTGLGSIPFEIIPNFINLAALPPDAPRRPDVVPPTGPYVLFVGTLGRFKGVHALVEIWRTAQPAAELVLLGTEAPDTPTDLPPGVTMHFDVPHADVLAAFANCEFSVLPSQFPEPSPTVLLEPMALGRPVVASAIGGIPDLVEHDVTGLLVPPLDNDALERAIVLLLADAEHRERLGRNALVRSRRFGVDAIVTRIVGAYESTLDAKASPFPKDQERQPS